MTCGAMPNHLQVYAIDLLGFGASAKPQLQEGYSMEVGARAAGM